MDDVSRAISMNAKRAGNSVYVAGLTFNELGGSQYYKMRGVIGNDVPRVDPLYGRRLMNSITTAIRRDTVISCHDCSDGGIAVALAEMAFAGGLGMNIRFSPLTMPKAQPVLPNDAMLFSESNTRFIIEVRDEEKFLKTMRGRPVWRLGEILKSKAFKIYDRMGELIIDTDIDKLKEAWRKPFKDI
jgi:phosphoribosylformylglycinamidine synthase